MVVLDTALFTASGFLAHHLSIPQLLNVPEYQFQDNNPTYILTAFWDIPKDETLRKELDEIKHRFGIGNEHYRSGVAVFVRTFGDVRGKNHDFDSEKLERFINTCIQMNTPFFIITSGIQWTEVCFGTSPLMQKLRQNPSNLLKLSDGSSINGRRQPGLQDRNGLTYFCMYSQEVIDYWDKNLRQMAEVVAKYSQHTLFRGICNEQETDMPGNWAAKGRDSDYNPDFIAAYSRFLNGFGNSLNHSEAAIRDMWDKFKVYTVRNRIESSAKIIAEAGVPKSKIFTHISTEDEKMRGSPLETGIVENAGNLGTVWWGGHFTINDMVNASEYACDNNKGWGILASNPRSLDPSVSKTFLEASVFLGANPIVLYCGGDKHFVGYGLKGLPIEDVVREMLA